MRFPDPDGDGWRSTWIGPRAGIVRPFIARPVGDEIILAGSFADGVETRWVFSDITDDSFAWRNEERAERGDDVAAAPDVRRGPSVTGGCGDRRIRSGASTPTSPPEGTVPHRPATFYIATGVGQVFRP